jgi:glycosyltransferase involved in cell wall biosynthesis
MKTFIVIPAYNEEKTIRQVVTTVLQSYTEVVVVDDGSTDGTWQALDGVGVHRLHHVLNRGQGAALQTGFDYALIHGADIIVTFDADGQHRVEDIATLVQPIHRGEADVVLGSRFLGRAENIPWHRRAMLRGAVRMTRYLAGIQVSDTHNGLRALSRTAATRIHLSMDRMAHASEILEIIGRERLRYVERPVTISYTARSLQKGQSTWDVIGLLFKLIEGRLLP